MSETRKKMIPIGIEDFAEMRKEDFYYIDKTGLIKDLLQNWGKVNLFTRPRRFGKSLNMSMLQHFFEKGTDQGIFDGLEISKETGLCEKYMGKFPVISVSLKGVSAGNYEAACKMAAGIVREAAMEHLYLLESGKLEKQEKEVFQTMLDIQMQEQAICDSLRVLCSLLQKHYNEKVVLLIDEYDVPLAKAFEHGYYDKMALFAQNMFSQWLKTNHSLQFAVLTGCLRVAKESIFTGLNNLKVLSITDVRFDEYFGFTDREVNELLGYYGLEGAYADIKDWYDGYRFGDAHIYCPWDVLNYCDLLRADPGAPPQDYWSNTSGNDVIRHFIKHAGRGTTKQELERLVAGEAVRKKVRRELTYRDLYSSVENIWSVLFTTGYLTQQGEAEGDVFSLAIPNMEIRKIFTEQIMEYFNEAVKKDGASVEQFCEALQKGDALGVQEHLGRYLKKAVSIRDTFVKKPMKENYYHGVLMGLLAYKEAWAVRSNQESGTGYSDILIELEEEEIGIVIEVKYPDGGDLEKGCQEALRQIEEREYAQQLLDDGMQVVLKYGVACYKKRCRVMAADDRYVCPQ
ncbi:MAG: ATP-binding protein [Acetatifactor sp.]|nr:ATP-binding protein [Acetatifactor sp.]